MSLPPKSGHYPTTRQLALGHRPARIHRQKADRPQKSSDVPDGKQYGGKNSTSATKARLQLAGRRARTHCQRRGLKPANYRKCPRCSAARGAHSTDASGPHGIGMVPACDQLAVVASKTGVCSSIELASKLSCEFGRYRRTNKAPANISATILIPPAASALIMNVSRDATRTSRLASYRSRF